MSMRPNACRRLLKAAVEGEKTLARWMCAYKGNRTPGWFNSAIKRKALADLLDALAPRMDEKN